jgi:hypothetical protein
MPGGWSRLALIQSRFQVNRVVSESIAADPAGSEAVKKP